MRAVLWLLLSIAPFFVPAPGLAAPTFSSSLTDWGNITIYGPTVTTSGGPHTAIVGQRTEWDHDFNGRFGPGIDGELEQNVWTEAGETFLGSGVPKFRSYHSLKGSLMPLTNGQGFTGFRTRAVYRDQWTFIQLGAPMGTDVLAEFSFKIHSRIGTLFPPGSSVAVGPDYYPYNPLWGAVPPGVIVVGPRPSTPPITLGLIVDNYRWYDYQVTPANTTATVKMGPARPGWHTPNLTVRNGNPFAVEIHFDAGWRMEHAEIVSILGATFERFSTNRVLDVGNTGVLSGVSFTDTNGLPLQGWSLVNSQGTALTFPVPEAPTSMLIAAGGLVVLALTRRQRRRDQPLPH